MDIIIICLICAVVIAYCIYMLLPLDSNKYVDKIRRCALCPTCKYGHWEDTGFIGQKMLECYISSDPWQQNFKLSECKMYKKKGGTK